jgi:glutaredoxin
VITIFGSTDCYSCIKSKQLLEIAQLEHEMIYVENDPERFRSTFPGEVSIPQIIWEGEHIGGYLELAEKVNETLENELKQRGESND